MIASVNSNFSPGFSYQLYMTPAISTTDEPVATKSGWKGTQSKKGKTEKIERSDSKEAKPH